MSAIKVFLVDDVELFLEFERELFERTGCEVLTATSGEEAIAIAPRERPHIILLDWEMPGMKGDEVCRILKKDPLTKHIPILIVTNFGDDSVRERCLASGATGFVVKPIAGKDLLEKVAELLEIPHRVFLRAPLAIEISIMGGGVKRKAEGTSEDVSETGMLLEVPEYIPRGSELAVEFAVPGQDLPLRVVGDVVRTYERRRRGTYGVGIRFGNVPPGVRGILRRYVDQAIAPEMAPHA